MLLFMYSQESLDVRFPRQRDNANPNLRRWTWDDKNGRRSMLEASRRFATALLPKWIALM